MHVCFHATGRLGPPPCRGRRRTGRDGPAQQSPTDLFAPDAAVHLYRKHGGVSVAEQPLGSGRGAPLCGIGLAAGVAEGHVGWDMYPAPGAAPEDLVAEHWRVRAFCVGVSEAPGRQHGADGSGEQAGATARPTSDAVAHREAPRGRMPGCARVNSLSGGGRVCGLCALVFCGLMCAVAFLCERLAVLGMCSAAL